MKNFTFKTGAFCGIIIGSLIRFIMFRFILTLVLLNLLIAVSGQKVLTCDN